MKFISALLISLINAPILMANLLPNPGFENGTEGWDIKEEMSVVLPEAAHEGSKGLRVTDQDATLGSSTSSADLPVQPGAAIKLTFWAKTEGEQFIGVYLIFIDAAGKWIKDEDLQAGQGLNVRGVNISDGEWNQYTLNASASAHAATVRVWIHSWSGAEGTADFDDFNLTIDGSGAAPIVPATAPAASPQTSASLPDLSARQTPPLIVIKADDLRPIDGKVHGLWLKFASFIEERGVKAGIGVLMDKLPEASPEYLNWVKQKRASGNFEFWYHGWDHAVHEVDGTKYNEFNNRSYEEQKKRFDAAQQAAQEKFGFPFTTFGPAGGVSNGFFDANTIRVMAEEPHMKAWLYPQPLDEQGKQLEAGGKVVILDRVWAVNIESKVGQPDSQKFLQGYAQNPGRAYFILQGHPTHWGSAERFGEFTKIVDFLIGQKAEFLTPSELALRLKSSRELASVIRY